MAGHVNRTLVLCLSAWCCMVLPAHAMGPSAPFVPPVAAQVAGGDVAVGAAETKPNGLTGVRLGKYAGAVIDGQWIRKGQAIRGARLVAIQRTKVTLRHPDGHQETIEMYPPLGGTADASATATTEAARP